MISAKIIADSVSYADKRIVTVELEYPRFIHSEVMTHRVFSRNAMSSRAVPVTKMLEQVRRDPAMPIKFMKNKPGMQATEDFSAEEHGQIVDIWSKAADSAAAWAEDLLKHNVHKQFANRLLEPFQWMRTIVTSTEWDNFFELRDHADAQPEFRNLAQRIRTVMDASKPVRRQPGYSRDAQAWHLPYVLDGERKMYHTELLPKLSAARCARVSYLTHDGEKPSPENDLALYARLVGSTPRHASPVEHQALPLKDATAPSANFFGWQQFRHMEQAYA